MADNDQLLEQIKKVVREENEPLKEGQKRLEQGLAGVKQSQAHTNTRVETVASEQSKIITALEAVKAGQDDLREKVANLPTRPEFQDFRADISRKVRDHESRIEELEKDADIPHPHKH